MTLKGHVAQPLRYPYFPGMRISDLIPSPDALISPDFYRRRTCSCRSFRSRYRRPVPLAHLARRHAGSNIPAPGVAPSSPTAAGNAAAGAAGAAAANAPGVTPTNAAGGAGNGASASGSPQRRWCRCR